jgi:hypothetical protein
MKLRVLAGLILTILSLTSAAQELVFPDLQGFKKVSNYPVFQPHNLWDFINGAADNYLALGFVDLHVAEYKKGKETVKLEVYRHSDATMAFGIYASERSPSFRFLNLGSQGYAIDGVINFFKGNYYVKIKTYSVKPKTIQSAESLSVRVADMLSGVSEMPSLLSKFPMEGKTLNDETYVNESVLGHQFLNKAFKANYVLGSDNFSIFLIKFNTNTETTGTAASYLKTAGIDDTVQENGKYVLNDKYNGTIFLAWNEDLMVIISGLVKDQAGIADRYTTEILK